RTGGSRPPTCASTAWSSRPRGCGNPAARKRVASGEVSMQSTGTALPVGTVRTIDRMYLVWVVLTLGIPFAIGYAVGGTWEAGLEGLVWGGLIRIAAYQHATFSVNSICHMFGRQDYRSRDEARNNWLVAILVFGEGWHNNHHAFPASARHGLRRWQFDVSWWVIRALERVRLVSNV